MFGRSDNNPSKNQELLNSCKRDELFIKSFVSFFISALQKRENVSVKLLEPELDSKYRKIVFGAERGRDVAGVVLEFAQFVPLIPSIGVTTDKALKIMKWGVVKSGKSVANKKAKRITENALQYDKETLQLIVEDIARDILIAFKYQISILEDNVSVARFAASGVGRAINLLSKYDLDAEENLGFKEVVLLGVISGEYQAMDLKVKLGDDVKEWETEDIYSKVGLLKRDGKHYVRNGCNPEEFGCRTELLDLTDADYKEEYKLKECRYKGYQSRTKFVSIKELSEYAEKCRDGDPIAKDKNFNKYIQDKDNLKHPIIAICRNQELINVDLSKADFTGSDLSESTFVKCNFYKAKLNNAYLQGVILDDVNLSKAQLQEAHMFNAIMDKITLKGADLHAANLTCSILEEIETNSETILTQIRLKNAEYDPESLEEALRDDTVGKRIIKLEKQSQKELDQGLRQHKEKLQKNIEDEASVQEPIEHFHITHQLELLKNAFIESSIVILAGIAGSGKTQLAKHYASKEHYGPVFKISGETLGSFNRDYRALAVSLAENTALNKAPMSTVKRAVLSALNKEENRGYLLLLDNIDSPEVKEHIISYIPQDTNNQGKIIITTQDSTLSLRFDSARISMYGWTSDEACLFLLIHLQGLPIPLNRENLATLAETFDNIPLGLDAARLYIMHHRISVEEYLELLEKETETISEQEDKLIKRDYANKNIRTAIRLARQKVLEMEEGEDAIKVLNLCSFLNPDSVKISLLQDIILNQENELTVLEAEIKAINAISSLCKLSLVTEMLGEKQGVNDTRYASMHRLVQSISRSTLPLDESKKYIYSLAEVLSKKISRDNNKPEDYNNHLEIIPHIESLLGFADQYKIEYTHQMHYLKICQAVLYDLTDGHELAQKILNSHKENIDSSFDINDQTDIKVIFDKLQQQSEYLPTLYSQILYYIGRSSLSLDIENEVSGKYFERAISLRDLIDSNPGYFEIDSKYNEGKQRPMDSVIFRRGGLIQWYNHQGYKNSDTKYLSKACQEYEKLLKMENDYTDNLRDKMNQGFCRIGIADTKVKIAELSEREDQIKLCNEALEVVCEHLKQKLEIEGAEKLNFEELFNKIEAKDKNDTRPAREYVLISSILRIRNTDDDLTHAEKFLRKAKELDNDKSHLTGNALFQLAKLYEKQNLLVKAKKCLEECILSRSKLDPKLIYEAKEMLKKISIEQPDKEGDVQPLILRTNHNQIKGDQIKNAILSKIQNGSVKKEKDEFILHINIGTEEEIEEALKVLGVKKTSFSIESEEKVGSKNKIYIKQEALNYIKDQLASNRQISK